MLQRCSSLGFACAVGISELSLGFVCSVGISELFLPRCLLGDFLGGF